MSSMGGELSSEEDVARRCKVLYKKIIEYQKSLSAIEKVCLIRGFKSPNRDCNLFPKLIEGKGSWKCSALFLSSYFLVSCLLLSFLFCQKEIYNCFLKGLFTQVV